MASRIEGWTKTSPFSLFLDTFDFPCGIALRGQVILHVQPGTLINDACLPAVMKALNAMPASVYVDLEKERKKLVAERKKRCKQTMSRNLN
jgi:hypothetical protein